MGLNVFQRQVKSAIEIRDLLGLANLLTLFRIFFSFIILSALFFNIEFLFAQTAYILAVITDLLDGFIARKFNLQTKLGKFLDPVADVFLSQVSLFFLTLKMDLPFFFLIVAEVIFVILLASNLIVYLIKRKWLVIRLISPGIAMAICYVAGLMYFFSLSFRLEAAWVAVGAGILNLFYFFFLLWKYFKNEGHLRIFYELDRKK